MPRTRAQIRRDILISLPQWRDIEQEWKGILSRAELDEALAELVHDARLFKAFFLAVAKVLPTEPHVAEFLFVESGSNNDPGDLAQSLRDFRKQPMDWLEKVAEDQNESLLWRLSARLLLAKRQDILNLRQVRQESSIR